MSFLNSNILFKNTLIFTVGEVLPKLLSFLLLPIYLSYFSPSDYGIIGYTNAITSFLPTLITLSLASFLLRAYFETNIDLDRKKLIGNVFVFIGITNILFYLSSILFFPSLIKYFKISIIWDPYLKFSFLTFFLDIFLIIPLVIYRLKRDAKSFVIISVSKVVLQYAVILFLIVNLGLGLKGFYYGSAIALIPYFFLSFYIIYKNAIFNFNFSQIKKGIKYSLPLIPSSIAYVLLTYFDRIILEKYISLSELGFYNLAYTLAFSLSLFISAVYKAIEPEILSKYSSSLSFEIFIKKFKNIFLFLLYFIAIILAVFTHDLFIYFVPIVYLKSSLYIPIIFISVLMTGHSIIYACLLTAEKQTKIIGFSIIISVIINIIINIILVPNYGVFGSAYASAISFMIINILYCYNLRYKKLKYINDIQAILLYILIIVLNNFLQSVIMNYLLLLCLKSIISSIAIIFLFAIFKINLTEIKTLLFKANIKNAII
jgi:O-antigen/teichoic acid export membrane protein